MLALLVTLALAEGLLRLLKINATYPEMIGQSTYFSPYWNDKNYWYVYKPNDTIDYSRTDFQHYRITNNLGIPERPLSTLPTDSTKKILCLGDSFTEGIGAPADSTWPKLLQNYLNSHSTDSFVVYNAGISGSDPVFEKHLLEGKLGKIHWSTVIFCINNTDISDCKIKGGSERFVNNNSVVYRKPPTWENIYAASYLFRLVINNLLQYNGLLLSKTKDKEFEKQALVDLEKTFRSTANNLSKKNTKLLIVAHPLNGEAKNKNFQNTDMDSLLFVIRDLKPLNLIPYFSNDTLKNKNLYWPHDGHFKPEGYQLMADEIGRIMLKH